MQFILIYPTGRIEVFSVKTCAELFQNAYGGTLISQALTVEEGITV